MKPNQPLGNGGAEQDIFSATKVVFSRNTNIRKVLKTLYNQIFLKFFILDHL